MSSPIGALTVETLLRHPSVYNIDTASALQIAICRALDGFPIGRDLWARAEVRRAFGGKRPPTGVLPAVFVILSAIRSAKSTICAAKAIVASQTVDMSRLKIGDEVRIPILAPNMDAARQTFTHLAAGLLSSPFLKSLLVGEPANETIWVRHPSGRSIEIVVTALSKYGTTLTSRWMASCIFDEAPRMVGEEDGRKNLDDAMRAVANRILPGGQILLPGSPFKAFGPVYDLVRERFGKPTKDLVIVRAPGADINPTIWTPEAIEAARRKPGFKNDVLAEFDDPDDAMFASDDVEACMRKEPLRRKPKPGVSYVAAMDPGARASAWTLVILGQTELGKFSIAVAMQWRARRGTGMDPRFILAEIRTLCAPYGITDVHTDQFSADALQALASGVGLNLFIHNIDADLKWSMAMAIRMALEDRSLELPPVREIREDLVRVKRKLISSSSRPSVQLPTSGDGRHCDFFTAIGLAMINPPDEPIPEEILAQKGEGEDDDPNFKPRSGDEWENAARAWG